MAYCRFSDGDVYLYHSSGGGIVCCDCRLKEKSGSQADPVFSRRSEVLAHIAKHREAGHVIPKKAGNVLRQEQLELGDFTESAIERRKRKTCYRR